jgi:hypothetical protein
MDTEHDPRNKDSLSFAIIEAGSSEQSNRTVEAWARH